MKLECGLDNRTKQAQSCYRDQRTLNFTNLLCLCQPSCQGFGPVAFISEGQLCLQVLCVCTSSIPFTIQQLEQVPLVYYHKITHWEGTSIQQIDSRRMLLNIELLKYIYFSLNYIRCLNVQSNFLPFTPQHLICHVVNYIKNKYTGCHEHFYTHLAEIIKHSDGL